PCRIDWLINGLGDDCIKQKVYMSRSSFFHVLEKDQDTRRVYADFGETSKARDGSVAGGAVLFRCFHPNQQVSLVWGNLRGKTSNELYLLLINNKPSGLQHVAKIEVQKYVLSKKLQL
ncbi:hypothetical protein DFQ29_003251, partial [Apophysomyces sp. BC1021]